MESLYPNAPCRELPKYQSHKIVHALKIKDIQLRPEGGVIVVPEDEGYGPFGLSAEYAFKHEPKVGGYYVQYPDGYESWSPADAFESGYTAI